jgi:hypothetical protein
MDRLRELLEGGVQQLQGPSDRIMATEARVSLWLSVMVEMVCWDTTGSPAP